MLNKDKKPGSDKLATPVVDAKKEAKAVRIINNASVALPINDVKLKPGKSAHFNDFDPDKPTHKEWLRANMIAIVK